MAQLSKMGQLLLSAPNDQNFSVAITEPDGVALRRWGIAQLDLVVIGDCGFRWTNQRMVLR